MIRRMHERPAKKNKQDPTGTLAESDALRRAQPYRRFRWGIVVRSDFRVGVEFFNWEGI